MKLKFKNYGFTLVEVLVALSILTIILGTLISRRSFFKERFQVEEQAYDYVNSIRRAQNETIAAKEFKCVANSFRTFEASYGVHINFDEPGRYIYFMDANGDGLYNDSINNCYFEEVPFSEEGFLIRICGTQIGSGSKRCYPEPSTINNFRNIDVTFKRPDSKPVIKFTNSSLNNTSPQLNAPAYLYFKYPGTNEEIEIRIEPTGQSSVNLIPST
jgi:prepilin-type N-terminal cleavage/methylation domain-containing protein